MLREDGNLTLDGRKVVIGVMDNSHSFGEGNPLLRRDGPTLSIGKVTHPSGQ